MASLTDGLGPYAELVKALQSAAGRNFNWVRDVTVSNSTWGNRELRIFEPSAGVHATGGGIGQGMPMAIGAAIGAAETASGRKTFCLAGDGGFILNLGELATAVQEQADMVIVLMNDKGYGVIKNIQDAQYGGRRCYADLHTPDYALLCKSLVTAARPRAAHGRVEGEAGRGAGEEGPVPAGDRHALHRRFQERLRRPADQHRHADSGARQGCRQVERTPVACPPALRIALVGCGAIGTSVLELLQGDAALEVQAIVVPAEAARPRRRRLAPGVQVVAVACLPMASTWWSRRLAMRPSKSTCCRRWHAARPAWWPRWARCRPPASPRSSKPPRIAGKTQVQLIAGAIGAIDALAAARIGGLDEVRYTGRKPPQAWKGTPAEQGRDLDALAQPTVIFEGSAREAARSIRRTPTWPPPSRSRASGLDRTLVRLIADPAAADNVHTWSKPTAPSAASS